MLKDDNPDKGTETLKSSVKKHCGYLLKDDNPDKGTETFTPNTSSLDNKTNVERW